MISRSSATRRHASPIRQRLLRFLPRRGLSTVTKSPFPCCDNLDETPRRDRLLPCAGSHDRLPALVERRDRPPRRRTVALCENGTGGDAADRLRNAIEQHGWSSWIDLTVIYPNLGFVGGNNAVIRPALESDDPPDYVLLLNADTLVKEDALHCLVAFMDAHPKVGIAGSQLLFADESVGPSAFRFPGIATEFDHGLRLGIVSKLLSRFSVMLPPAAEAAPVGWVPGTSMILRRTMLEQIGLLDDGLYTYFDDPDICLRRPGQGGKSGASRRVA